MLDIVEQLNSECKGKTPQEVIVFFLKKYKNKIAFASSMGAEDQVLTDMIAGISKEARIITLDTGRIFQETYDLIDKTQKKYGNKIEILFPDAKQVEGMVSDKGINLFYESVENRKLCCHIRKKEPLTKVFQSLDVWICGVRRDQSITRYNSQLVEWDEDNGLIKVSPLVDWTNEMVWEYIKTNDVPYNELHDKGYPSVGCQACTRAVKEGEDIRSGRWWWEDPENKECGLHNRK